MSNILNIYFDARMLGYSGIGTQIEEVISLLMNHKDIHLTLIGNSKKIRTHFPQVENIHHFDVPIYTIKEQFLFPDLIQEKGLYHFPHYNVPIKYVKNGIVVIHDLIHLDSEEFQKFHYRFYTKTLLKQILKKAKAIITVSEYTKMRLLEEFPFYKGENIYVNHNGINTNVFYPASSKHIKTFIKKYELPVTFLLAIGIGKKHKNLDGLLLALKDLWETGFSIPLVVSGTNKKIPDYVKAILTDKILKNIYFLPYIPKEELNILYSSAYLFIMPSKIEGFGFPLLEAMACGVPTISSNQASLPEIGGDATIFFDPYSKEDMKNKILEVCSNNKIRKNLISRGNKHVKKFDWNKHVKLLVDIYKKYY